jgi:hypothetical protein
MRANVRRCLSNTGDGITFLAFFYAWAGVHSFKSPGAYIELSHHPRVFLRTWAFARAICFPTGNGQGLGSRWNAMVNHQHWRTYRHHSLEHRCSGGGIAWQGRIHVNAFMAFHILLHVERISVTIYHVG